MKETDLYKPVCALFTGEIYPEVVVHKDRPDIVINNKGHITVVEMKTSLSLALIEQAYNWVGRCNSVYVAIPKPKKPNLFAVKLLKDKGIGVIMVAGERAYIHSNSLPMNSKIQWSKYLHEFYKLNEAGGTNGEYMTSYKFLIICIREYLGTQKEPVSTNDIIKAIDKKHDNLASKHYANPRQSINKALSDYEKHWCTRHVIKGSLHFSGGK